MIARTWKGSRCPSIDEWIMKMWWVYIIKFDPALKKSEIIEFAAKWMNLESIILNYIN